MKNLAPQHSILVTIFFISTFIFGHPVYDWHINYVCIIVYLHLRSGKAALETNKDSCLVQCSVHVLITVDMDKSLAGTTYCKSYKTLYDKVIL